MHLEMAMYLGIGCIVGLLSGMLGVGGGILIVVLLNAFYSIHGFASGNMYYLVLGTSMASITISTFASFWVHKSKGAVDWTVFRKVIPGTIIFTIVGTMLAPRMPIGLLKSIFMAFIVYVGIQLFLDYKPKPGRALPGSVGLFILGGVTGCFSGMLGIAGGNIFIPAALWFNMPMRTAVGTSAGIGSLIALTGALGYYWQGHAAQGLPEWSLGYIYLPAVLGIAVTGMIAAPIGATVTHRVPVRTLKRCYAVFLFFSAARMAWGLFL